MTWFLFAMLGTAIFGLVALTDKYMLTAHVRDPLVYAWTTGTLGGALSAIGLAVLVPARGPILPGGRPTAWLLVSGALLFLAGFAYMRAMSAGAAPVVVAFSQLTPAFALVLGFWALAESPSVVQLLGMALVMGSAVALAFDRSGLPGGASRGALRGAFAAVGAVLPIMLVSCVFRAASDLLLKQRTGEIGVVVAYLVSRQGITVCALLMLLHPRLRRRIVAGLRVTTLGSWGRLLGIEVAAFLSFYLLAVALSRGPLALVSVISSNVAVFTLAYAVLLGRVFKLPNVPPIGVAWQRLTACLALMALGTTALTALF